LTAAQKEPQTIPLDRGGSRDSALRKKKREQALKDQQKRKGTKVKEAHARERSTIKLPAAVIDIEDLSHMEIKRGRDVDSLIPRVDRKDFLKEGYPGDFQDPATGKKRKKAAAGGKGSDRTLSQMEITYGTFNSLGALVMTGMERKLFSYQVSFRRNRDEGFSKDGSRVANSSTGSDNLLLDIGWSRDRFESSISLRFDEKRTALQANTNFSQSRNSGVLLDWKGSYIFSSAGSFRFNLGFSGDRFVLDNPVNQETVVSLGLRAGTFLDFNWADRSFLKIALIMMYQDMDADTSEDVQLRDPVFALEGGFGFGVVSFSAGLALHVPGLESALAAPFARLSVNSGGRLSFYFLIKRDVNWMDHNRMLMWMPYAAYAPAEEPEESWRSGGGGKLKLGPFVLTCHLFYLAYSRYYAPEENGSGLYALKEHSPGMFELSAEARVFLYKNLSLRFAYLQRMLGYTVPYFPEILFRAAAEWRFPGLKTLLTVRGRIEGSRNDGALDPYCLLDLGVRQPIIRGFFAVFMLRNLLNSDYRQRVGYAEPGISLHAGVNFRF